MPDTLSFLSHLLSIAHWSPLHLLIPLAVIQRVAELRVAKRNERIMRSRGAVEAGAAHYPAIVALHSVWFIGMIAEIVLLTRAVSPFWPAFLLIFLLAQGLRYWAIRSLGTWWNTRILVVPGGRTSRRGPYRYMKHPNYLAVVLELFTLPALYGAYLTAITASIINAILLRVRIRTEERALHELGKEYEKVGRS